MVAENTNNFTPACDAILHADEFARLPQFVQLAREGVKAVNRSYIVALSYNAIGLSFAVAGALSPVHPLKPNPHYPQHLIFVPPGNRDFHLSFEQ